MNRLLLSLPAIVFATSAFAQTAPADATKDLWCGTAFLAVFSEPPPDATPELLAQAQPYIDGGNMLIDRAALAHKGAGFSDDQVVRLKTDVDAKVSGQIKGGAAATPDYTFDDCAALLTPSEPVASAPAP